MKQTFENLIAYLKFPYHSESYKDIKGKDFIYLLLIMLFLVIPYALILDWAGMDQFDHHGMKWAIIFHGVYNAVLVIPAIYFYEP
ncbi:hypothetical protein [Aquiflexum lacus]|uniref:hypothetical protein n=1 Tax=Aquiflexum lacus TaxID=2483805 RepID=UPI00189545BA|nr:hypothetical protein [Aquiflexum lacus]